MKQEITNSNKKCEKGCNTVVHSHTLIIKMSDGDVKVEFHQCEKCTNKTIYIYKDDKLKECFDLE